MTYTRDSLPNGAVGRKMGPMLIFLIIHRSVRRFNKDFGNVPFVRRSVKGERPFFCVLLVGTYGTVVHNNCSELTPKQVITIRKKIILVPFGDFGRNQIPYFLNAKGK